MHLERKCPCVSDVKSRAFLTTYGKCDIVAVVGFNLFEGKDT